MKRTGARRPSAVDPLEQEIGDALQPGYFRIAPEPIVGRWTRSGYPPRVRAAGRTFERRPGWVLRSERG